MAKILLTTIGDEEALGIRALAKTLENTGHTPLLLYLGAFISNVKPWHNESLDDDKYMVVTDSGDITAWSNPLENLDQRDRELYEAEIRNFQPDIIAFSGRSFFDSQIGAFFKEIKKNAPNAWLVSGGHGPTFAPAEWLEEGGFVIRGEGEDALVQLANIRDNGNLSNLASIPNLCYKNENGIVVRNPLAPSKTSEDIYPNAPFLYGRNTIHIINGQKFANNAHTQAYYTLAGRGCLMRCSYCGGGNWTKIYADCGISIPKRRRRPLDGVIAELAQVKDRHDIKFVHFCDEHFAYPRDALLRFFKDYQEKIGLPFFLYFHAAQIAAHPEILDAAADAGLHQASLGIQTGDEEFALKIYNRKNQNDIIRRCAILFAKKNIHCDYQFIQGSPWENREKVFKDYEFIASLPYNGQNTRLIFTWFTPHKGAPILDACRKIGKMRAPVNEFLLNSLFLALGRYLPFAESMGLYDDPSITSEPKKLAPILAKEFARQSRMGDVIAAHALNT